MGKVTFRRVVRVLHRSYVVVCLPVAGGALFLAGSFLFWPGASEQMEQVGALCFLVGSSCYWAAPFMDFFELSWNQANLLDAPRLPRGQGQVLYVDQAAALYEHLYKAHLLRMQRANCLIYMLGGIFFVGGSTLFFPGLGRLIMHGGWLYISGCLLTLLGAILASVTAYEMMKTAHVRPCGPVTYHPSAPCLALPFWSDEVATIVSCSFYVGGNLVFIAGSILFFPRILEAGGPLIRLLACVLFIFGSVLFLIGAVIDLIVLSTSAPRWCITARTHCPGRDSESEGLEMVTHGAEMKDAALSAASDSRNSVLRRHYRSRSAPLPLSISVGMRNGGMVVKQRETRKCKLDRQSEEHPAVASPKPRGVRPWWALRSYQEMDEDAHRKRSKEVASTSGTHPLSCRCGKLSDATAQVARKESSVRAVSHFHSKSELLVSKQPEGPTPRVCEAAHDRESCRV